MQVFALWHGGSSYSAPSAPQDVEAFASVAAAKQALVSRRFSLLRQPFPYVNREQVLVDTPAVDEYSRMYLFLSAPADADAYPDFVLEFGPRGGVTKTAC